METSDLKILIVEDDLSFSIELEMMVEEIGYSVAANLDNSGEVLEFIMTTPPDLILMDIDIKGNLNGVQIGQKIKHLDIPIIYITSFDDQENFDASKKSNSAGYLVKPSNKFTLQSTIESAVEKIKLKREISGEKDFFNNSIFIKKNNLYHKVYVRDIQYIEADGNLSMIYLAKGKFLSNLGFGEFELLLPHNLFIKIHRSYIANLKYFSSMNTGEGTMTMENGKEIPISRTHKQKIIDLMNTG